MAKSTVPTILTDAGRSIVYGRRNWPDCAIRVLSIVLSDARPTGRSYELAEAIIGEYERRDGKAGTPWTRTNRSSSQSALADEGYKLVWSANNLINGEPLRLTAQKALAYVESKQHDGPVVVYMAGHVSVILDGFYCDSYKISTRKRVQELWARV